MSRTLLLIGTRKGAFFLESSDRKTWVLGGPFCEDWPVYHVIHDPNSGAVYAAAASEWHGQAVWRSADLGESWTHSSEGIAYDAGAGRKISKVSTLAIRRAARGSRARQAAVRLDGCGVVSRGGCADRKSTCAVAA
jgi:hypothetical protein